MLSGDVHGSLLWRKVGPTECVDRTRATKQDGCKTMYGCACFTTPAWNTTKIDEQNTRGHTCDQTNGGMDTRPNGLTQRQGTMTTKSSLPRTPLQCGFSWIWKNFFQEATERHGTARRDHTFLYSYNGNNHTTRIPGSNGRRSVSYLCGSCVMNPRSVFRTGSASIVPTPGCWLSMLWSVEVPVLWETKKYQAQRKGGDA